MNNPRITKCCLIAAAIAILAVFTAAPVGARELNWKLRGDYAWNSTSTCASAPWGFGQTVSPTPPFMPVFRKPSNPPQGQPVLDPAPGISYNYSVQGVLSFDGHGVLNFKNGEVLSIILEPYPNPAINPPLPTSSNFRFPVHHYEMECTGTYVVDDEGVVGITFASCGVGTTFEGATLQGRLDTVTGTSIVFLSNTSPTIEDVHGFPTPVQRICNATGSMVKLSPRKNWFSKE
jgi:hypothetical protein